MLNFGKFPLQSALKNEFNNTGVGISSRVNKLVQPTQKNAFIYSTISSLQMLLKKRGHLFRPKQIETIQCIINDLKEGHLEGLLKLPTGVGKTRLFGEIIAAIQRGALILVPRVNLLGSTRDELIGNARKRKPAIPGILPQKLWLIDANKRQPLAKQVESVVKSCEGGINPVVLMTYQSFTAAYKADPNSIGQLLGMVGMVVSDEAHRSIGDRTKKLREELIRDTFEDMDDEEFNLMLNEEIIEQIIAKNSELYPHIHLLFTATPKLGNKDVRDYFDHTFNYVSVQEVIEDGTLIFPQHITVGKAHAFSTLENITQDEITNLSVSDRFLSDDKKTPIREKIALKYQELLLKHHGYLPAVGFCRNIEQAEQIRVFLSTLGIRSIRVTSSNAEYDEGVSTEDAELMLERNEVDIILTVSKVAEGWDVPTLRAALWFSPTESPAKAMQGNGRIMRTLDTQSNLPKKSSENTYIIEPSSWSVNSGANPFTNNDSLGGASNSGSSNNERNTLVVGQNSYDIFLAMGELSGSFLLDRGVLLNERLGKNVLDEKDECIIGGEVWMCITKDCRSLPFSGFIAQRLIDNQSPEWLSTHHAGTLGLNRSTTVKLYRKSAVEALLPHTVSDLNADGECEIDGEIWTSVRKNSQNLSVSGHIALGIIEKQTPEWMLEHNLDRLGRIGAGKFVKIYRKSALENSIKVANRIILDSNGECEIEGETWICVSPSVKNLSASFKVCQTLIKKQSAEWMKNNQGERVGILANNQTRIYRKSALEKIIPNHNNRVEVDDEGRCMIHGESWVSVGKGYKPYGIKKDLMLSTLAKQSKEWMKENHAGRIGLARTVSVPIFKESAIIELFKFYTKLIEVDANGECEIEGETWSIATQEGNSFPVSHKLVQSALKRQDLEWLEKHHQGKMSKRHIPSKLYRKSAVLAILPTILDAQGECEIEGETWIKLDSLSKSESLSYKTLMTLIEKQSPEWMIENHNGRMAQTRTGLCAIYKKTALKSILPVKLDANGEGSLDQY